MTSPEAPRGPRFATERDLFQHVVSRGRRLRRRKLLVHWGSSFLAVALLVGGVSFGLTAAPTQRRITLPATEAPTTDPLPTGDEISTMAATPMPPETPSTPGPEGTPLACRNSRDPRCGAFSWDPPPPANQPLTIEIVDYRPEHPKVGDMVVFQVRIRDTDATTGAISAGSFGDLHYTNNRSRGCIWEGYGPWTPPTPKGFDITIDAPGFRAEKAGTFEASFRGFSETTDYLVDLCLNDPYASTGRSPAVSVVVTEASPSPTTSPTPEPSATSMASPAPIP